VPFFLQCFYSVNAFEVAVYASYSEIVVHSRTPQHAAWIDGGTLIEFH
jgi:hypothetical protein